MNKQQSTIWEDLCALQAEIPTIGKSKTAGGGSFSYKYADLSDIWAVIRPILRTNNFSLIQTIETKENLTYMITMLCHTSGEKITSETKIDYSAKDIKGMGSLFTYYRRYTMSAMLGIVSDEDVDDIPKGKDGGIYNTYISSKQQKEIETLINGHQDIRERMEKTYKSFDQIEVDKFDRVVSTIKKLIEDKQ